MFNSALAAIGPIVLVRNVGVSFCSSALGFRSGALRVPYCTRISAAYRDTAPALATWLENAAPEGLAVFPLPEHHRRRLRTSNPIERAVQQELKRRTVKVRVFPNHQALLRLVSAVLVEIDKTWVSDNKACPERVEGGYIKWECRNA